MRLKIFGKDGKRWAVYAVYLLIFSILVIGIVTSCELLTNREISIISINGNDIKIKAYLLKRLNYESLPQGYTGKSPISLKKLEEIVGLPTRTYKGQKGYHPVQTARLLLNLLNSYKITKNPAYLGKARFISDMYINTAVESNEALYFPYTFDFYLHGIEKELMKSPWYSGMAQGISLSVYVRFYQITNEPEYLRIAEKIFRSFMNFRNTNNNPWVVYIDNHGYYWIEEYPIWPPANTLNGFIYGIFGLYEYWLLKQDYESRVILRAAITTIERHIARFRNKNDISFYCLKHKIKSKKYHELHINQLHKLYLITGEKYFKEMADRLQSDH